MNKLQIKQGLEAEIKLNSFPKEIKAKLNTLRSLILETANEVENIDSMEETLKWGELSYLVKKGSTIRMDWKAKTPGQYALYFKCTSKLVPTFKALFKDTFTYEGNRALVFDIHESLPVKEVKECIRMALTYHSIKHLALLGGRGQ